MLEADPEFFPTKKSENIVTSQKRVLSTNNFSQEILSTVL